MIEGTDPEYGLPKYVPDWTIYEHEEFSGRITIIIDELAHIRSTGGRVPTTQEIGQEALSWAHTLETVPTNHLGRSITRAKDSWKSAYAIPASVVLAAWDDIQKEIVEGLSARPEPDPRVPALPSGSPDYVVLEYITVRQFKELRGLPEEWKIGDPIPGSEPQHNYTYFPQDSPLPDSPRFLHVKPSPRWFRRRRAPWEIYGTREDPMVRESVRQRVSRDSYGYESTEYVRTEARSFVERCPAIEYPGVECPGYVTEYITTVELRDGGGEQPTRVDERRHQCPLHPME